MSPPTDSSIDPSQLVAPSLPPVPALPEPINHHEHEEPVAEMDHGQHVVGHHHVEHIPVEPKLEGDHNIDPNIKFDPDDPNAAAVTPKKRNKKLPLTFHEALTFAGRGVYVDIETGQLRCSCNHKPCDKWDAYGYTRHFGFKCHKKYEEERLDDAEIARLKDSKETFMRMNPIVEESSIRKKRKMKEGEKILSVDELRVQERHWMEMWKDAKNELKQLRQDLKVEVDEEVRGELIADIEGLKKRKGDWAKLLGLNDMSQDHSITL